jgi:hypothetical protein
LSHLPNSLWSTLKESAYDLISLGTMFGKLVGLTWDGDKKKVERTDDLSHYHLRHFRHRQLPNGSTPSPKPTSPLSMNIFSSPAHVRTRRSSTLPHSVWQSISIAESAAAVPNEIQELKIDEPSTPLLSVNQLSSRVLSASIRSRRIKKKKYSTLQALYMTLYLGELRVDLIDLLTTVCIPLMIDALFLTVISLPQIIDDFIIGPSNRLKKWMKGSTTT